MQQFTFLIFVVILFIFLHLYSFQNKSQADFWRSWPGFSKSLLFYLSLIFTISSIIAVFSYNNFLNKFLIYDVVLLSIANFIELLMLFMYYWENSKKRTTP